MLSARLAICGATLRLPLIAGIAIRTVDCMPVCTHYCRLPESLRAVLVMQADQT